MKCDELKKSRIVLSTEGSLSGVEWFKNVYNAEDVDEAIAELKAENERLKDKCQMHDFFWEGNGFDKMGFKNAIQVREYIDKLKAENERLKNSVVWFSRCRKAERKLRATRRALWLSRADRAHKEVILFRDFSCLVGKEFKWRKIEKLCRAKADTFKEDV